jgi:predicted AlkP superfamily phosphohydrolase/phosphomutase
MKSSAKKVMVLGMDCPVVPRVQRWATEGRLPIIQKLLEEGVYASNCLVPYPTITPPNSTTITTGAWPGTHGITDFWVHYPGDPLDLTHNAFDSRDCLAERVSTAGERMGKTAIVVNYRVTWPPTVKNRYQSSLSP